LRLTLRLVSSQELSVRIKALARPVPAVCMKGYSSEIGNEDTREVEEEEQPEEGQTQVCIFPDLYIQ
jgi:hypothetical protein